ncbi:MAG: alginate export family protein [Methylococcales bacterium]|nr:alginate export family protein [Methylococcales bacterium]
MKRRKHLATAAVSHALNLIVAGCFYMSSYDTVQAAEKKNYTRVPFAAFSSQMSDALFGSGKYEKPAWNLHDALKAPNWLDVSVEQRSRYETMSGTFKAGSIGGDQQIPLQTTLWLQAHLGSFRLGTEFMDARALNSDSGTGVNNTMSNTWDFLQAYAAWLDQNVFYSGIGAEVVAGRQTLNLGSRRLVARNAMRNTINNFTGVKLRLTDYVNWQFNGFVSTPVNRLPTSSTALLDNKQVFDRENTHTWFSGGFLELYNLGWKINSEIYLYHLDEGDSTDSPSRNRRYFTPGMRFYIKPAKAEFDFQLETIGQFGTVRATTAARDSKNLNHTAWYQHADVGYTFNIPWSPRLGLEYDYASGDQNPNDNKDQRFDTLFGARRFDFGPTGIYGAFSRSNITTPGYRINVSPRSNVLVSFSHRIFWLAAAKDCWGGTTCSGSSLILQDKTGRSGNNLGQQLDLSTRWDFNSSLNFETGWAHLFKGSFAKNAPAAPAPVDVDYFYVQSMLRF